jgi:hypothetical protein
MSNTTTLQSNIMKLQTLEAQYTVVLNQYKQAYQNYLQNLNNYKTTSSTYVALKGKTFWGTSALTQGSATSQTACQTMCTSNSSCSGATFNPVKKYCWTRTGDGVIGSGLSTDYALITPLRQSIITLQSINLQLLSINSQITTLLQTVYPQASTTMSQKNTKATELNNYYQTLVQENNQIQQLLNEYNTINQSYQEADLYTTEQNIRYRFWFLVAVILMVITIKTFMNTGTSEVPLLTAIYWPVLFILFIILTFNIQTPQGFLVWGILAVVAIISYLWK